MRCLDCGKQLPEEAIFCLQCGEQNFTPDDSADLKKTGKRARKGVIEGLAMRCLDCGKQLPEEAFFCLQCGEQNFTPDDNADPEKNGVRIRKGVIALIAILGVGACVSIALVVQEILKDRSQTPTTVTGTPVANSTRLPMPTPTPTSIPTPFWKAESYAIDTKTVALLPDEMWWRPLHVKNDWRDARLVGKFMAQGGEKNDIEAFVTNEIGMINWRKDQLYQPQVWYKSGRVTEDTINAPLPTGQSYFIFNNRFPVAANKMVRFDLRIEYKRLVQP
jgi:hypothetical protein